MRRQQPAGSSGKCNATNVRIFWKTIMNDSHQTEAPGTLRHTEDAGNNCRNPSSDYCATGTGDYTSGEGTKLKTNDTCMQKHQKFISELHDFSFCLLNYLLDVLQESVTGWESVQIPFAQTLCQGQGCPRNCSRWAQLWCTIVADQLPFDIPALESTGTATEEIPNLPIDFPISKLQTLQWTSFRLSSTQPDFFQLVRQSIRKVQKHTQPNSPNFNANLIWILVAVTSLENRVPIRSGNNFQVDGLDFVQTHHKQRDYTTDETLQHRIESELTPGSSFSSVMKKQKMQRNCFVWNCCLLIKGTVLEPFVQCSSDT